MSGHSKWSTIKHRKGAIDQKRGKIFNRLVREIMVAARVGGKDTDANGRLRIGISKARAANMPQDTIKRAIKKGSGGLESVNLEEIRYEIFASGGIAIIVDALTDKKGRTTPEIKSIINKFSANLAESGAAVRLFQKYGIIHIAKEIVEEEELFEIALDAGADDMNLYDDYFEIRTSPEDFSTVVDRLTEKKLETLSAEIALIPIPGGGVELEKGEKTEKIFQLLENLEEHPDVQAVYHNITNI